MCVCVCACLIFKKILCLEWGLNWSAVEEPGFYPKAIPGSATSDYNIGVKGFFPNTITL